MVITDAVIQIIEASDEELKKIDELVEATGKEYYERLSESGIDASYQWYSLLSEEPGYQEGLWVLNNYTPDAEKIVTPAEFISLFRVPTIHLKEVYNC